MVSKAKAKYASFIHGRSYAGSRPPIPPTFFTKTSERRVKQTHNIVRSYVPYLGVLKLDGPKANSIHYPLSPWIHGKNKYGQGLGQLCERHWCERRKRPPRRRQSNAGVSSSPWHINTLHGVPYTPVRPRNFRVPMPTLTCGLTMKRVRRRRHVRQYFHYNTVTVLLPAGSHETFSVILNPLTYVSLLLLASSAVSPWLGVFMMRTMFSISRDSQRPLSTTAERLAT
jgi:hypothetical protein